MHLTYFPLKCVVKLRTLSHIGNNIINPEENKDNIHIFIANSIHEFIIE